MFVSTGWWSQRGVQLGVVLLELAAAVACVVVMARLARTRGHLGEIWLVLVLVFSALVAIAAFVVSAAIGDPFYVGAIAVAVAVAATAGLIAASMYSWHER